MSEKREQQALRLERIAWQWPTQGDEREAALRAGAAALLAQADAVRKCEWRFDDAWRTTCGLTWSMDNDAMPVENQMSFCPKCGGRLVDLDAAVAGGSAPNGAS